MTKIRGKTDTYICKNKSCKKPFVARVADRNRGWALYCSKTCKAVVQEKRTGQYKDYLYGNAPRSRLDRIAKKVGAPSTEMFINDSREYGGIPQYDSNGEYIGHIKTSFEDDSDYGDDDRY